MYFYLTGSTYFFYALRKSEITLKCNQSTPGDGIIPKFTETKLSETSSLYVSINALVANGNVCSWSLYLAFVFSGDEMDDLFVTFYIII